MNVVVFALHGCPVSALGPYGNEWIGTPNLDRLAAKGIVFDRHISDCPEPVAARRAWRSGRHQFPALDPNPSKTKPTTAVSLLTALKERGVRTVLVRQNRPENDVDKEFYDQWHERFDARPEPADDSPADALLRALPAILEQLKRVSAWLLWIEIDRLLPPWDVHQEVFEAYVEDLLEVGESEPEDEEEEDEGGDPDPSEEASSEVEPIRPWDNPPVGWFDRDDVASWELLHRSFATVMTVFDAELGRVFELLRESGLDRAVAWVFTADRGFPLGEHGLIGPHRPWLHEELVHVPLIIRLPDAQEAGRRVAGITQPADLMPTLAGWLGAAPATGDGVDLMKMMTGSVEVVRPFACSGLELGPAAEWALRSSEWAYLLPGRPHPEDDPREPMLFLKPDDRWEVNDLRVRTLERAEELDQMLREALNRRE